MFDKLVKSLKNKNCKVVINISSHGRCDVEWFDLPTFKELKYVISSPLGACQLYVEDAPFNSYVKLDRSGKIKEYVSVMSNVGKKRLADWNVYEEIRTRSQRKKNENMYNTFIDGDVDYNDIMYKSLYSERDKEYVNPRRLINKEYVFRDNECESINQMLISVDGSEPRLLDPSMIVEKNVEEGEYVFSLEQLLLFLKSYHYEYVYIKDDACSALNEYCEEKRKVVRELKKICDLKT